MKLEPNTRVGDMSVDCVYDGAPICEEVGKHRILGAAIDLFEMIRL